MVALGREPRSAESSLGPWRMWLATLSLCWVALDLRGWAQPGASLWWNGDLALCQSLVAWAGGIPLPVAVCGWLLLACALAPWQDAPVLIQAMFAALPWLFISRVVGRERLRNGGFWILFVVAGGIAVLRSFLKLWAGEVGLAFAPSLNGPNFLQSVSGEALLTLVALILFSIFFRGGVRCVRSAR